MLKKNSWTHLVGGFSRTYQFCLNKVVPQLITYLVINAWAINFNERTNLLSYTFDKVNFS